ncbi:response regulator [Paenibacillus sp. S150]|uniref:response regulator transcription factor n=1 Tax=Paenibacillus sp. S150 TaxID=2749826 RepID=UPI001C599617|nr:response regulator [Paenibacillus sp. S150]MBW4082226.1 response regulator [Paenibacillus sp. S150]
MNLKVLIVDDEMLIRRMLCKMIVDNRVGWTIAGEAANGEEAVSLIEERRPDLVITDIRMPIMDGIRLAEHIHLNHPDVQVVILTAYKDFAYAQAAVKFKVADFLLKPSPEQEVLDLLVRVRRSMIAARQKRLKQRQMMEQMCFRSICLRLPYDASVLGSIRESYAGAAVWAVQVDDYFPPAKPYTPADRGLLHFSIVNVMEEMLSSAGGQAQNLIVPIDYDSFIVLGEGRERHEQVFDVIKRTVHALLGIQMSAAPLGTLEHPQQLAELYDQAGQSRIRQEEPESRIGMPGEREPEETEGAAAPFYVKIADNHTVPELKELLLTPLRVGEYGQFKLALDELLQRLDKLPLGDMKLEAFMLAYVLDAVSRQEFQFDLDFAMAREIANQQRISSKEDVREWIRRYADRFLEQFELWKVERSETVVDKVQEFVERHYMETCSLAEAAAYVYLSPKYVSDLFKKRTGISFTHYVTQVRIKKAEMLLSNTTLKVTEIANRVGFNDPNYFSTVFRKALDVSPAQFRKR